MAEITKTGGGIDSRLEAGLRRALDPITIPGGLVPVPRYAYGSGTRRPGRLLLSLTAAAVLTVATGVAAAAANATGTTDPGAWGRHLSNSVHACRASLPAGIGSCVQAVIAADPQGRGIGLTTHSAHSGLTPPHGDSADEANPGAGSRQDNPGQGNKDGQSGAGHTSPGAGAPAATHGGSSKDHPDNATPCASTDGASRDQGTGCPKS